MLFFHSPTLKLCTLNTIVNNNASVHKCIYIPKREMMKYIYKDTL